MNKTVLKAEAFARSELSSEPTGHDFFHTDRVRKMALFLSRKEGANPFIVEIAALLHDIADEKFKSRKKSALKSWINHNLDKASAHHIIEIIDTLSFRGARVKTTMRTIEGKVVQDADRLDALGAIGIARCFATSARLGCPIYDPSIKPQPHTSYKAYRKHDGTAINHFYEKLLLLKGLMNTKTAKKIAERRHKAMERYLDEFYKEWKMRSIS
ncbi:MAG: HD domain-containing protein [Nanoarchaeota archaeon]